MRIALWVVGALLGLALVLGTASMLASESGEVVVLTTRDAAGASHETRLWVVDHQGAAWLRAGADAQAWYQRLLSQPEVEVLRAGSQAAFSAVPQPEQRPAINQLMQDKYGWADRFIGMLFGRDDAIPVRLDPR